MNEIAPQDYRALSFAERRALRAAYAEQQGGLCMWCKGALDAPPPPNITRKRISWRLFPPNFLRHPVHLQHCHQTGKTEGAVHAYCNAVMWQYHGR